MGIKRIRAQNFKSFKSIDLELGDFTVLIGANAAGKSNFVSLFSFLRTIKTAGLKPAIELQGGADYLRNINSGPGDALSVTVVFDNQYEIGSSRIPIQLHIGETSYSFALRFDRSSPDNPYQILSDEMRQKCRFFRVNQQNDENPEDLGEGELVLSRGDDNRVHPELHAPESVALHADQLFPEFIEGWFEPESLILETHLVFPFSSALDTMVPAIYDFQPGAAKGLTPVFGRGKFDTNGGNLPFVLHTILVHEPSKRKFLNLIEDLLPFVHDVMVENIAGKQLGMRLLEAYSKDQFLPALAVSDGTISIIALIIALYFEDDPIAIVEEPDRNIHPYLLSRLVEMLKDASSAKQLIITTHNPELVKYAGVEPLLLISRDTAGFSTISRPTDRAELAHFLAHEIGIEELFVQNMLGA